MPVTGTWTLKIDHKRAPDQFELRLVEDSTGGLTGSITPQNSHESVPLTGQGSGSSISWKATVAGYTGSFSGRVEGNTITGKVTVPYLIFFSWSANFRATR